MKRLKELRMARNITQAEMAKQLGMVTRNYMRYESGEVDPPLSKARFLADHFNVSLDYLVGRTDDPHGGYCPTSVSEEQEN